MIDDVLKIKKNQFFFLFLLKLIVLKIGYKHNCIVLYEKNGLL